MFDSGCTFHLGRYQAFILKCLDANGGAQLARAGILIFLAVYVALTILAVSTMVRFQRIPKGEETIPIVVIAALPLLLVRIIFGILSLFYIKGVFSILYGNAFVYLAMVVLEELAIVVMFVGVGLAAPMVKQQQAQLHSKSMQRRGSSKFDTALRAIEPDVVDPSHGDLAEKV